MIHRDIDRKVESVGEVSEGSSELNKFFNNIGELLVDLFCLRVYLLQGQEIDVMRKVQQAARFVEGGASGASRATGTRGRGGSQDRQSGLVGSGGHIQDEDGEGGIDDDDDDNDDSDMQARRRRSNAQTGADAWHQSIAPFSAGARRGPGGRRGGANDLALALAQGSLRGGGSAGTRLRQNSMGSTSGTSNAGENE